MASRYRTRQYTATVGTSEQLNPLKRSYVTLAQNADSSSLHEQSEPVVIGNRVSVKAIRRSGLLSGLAETEGLASLPARLSPDDIQLWEAAYVMNLDLSSEDLAAVLHVADVLEDGHTGQWVEMLSKRISSAKWADTQQASDMLCSLLQLPSHLLRRVLAACLATNTLHDLLAMLPGILYPALIATCAASGSMTLPGSAGHLQMTLSQLAATSCPPPGLRSLSLPGSISKRAGSVTTAALLAHAVSSHPTLTSLTLSSVTLPVRFFHQLGLGLTHSALPRLVRLEAAIQIHPDGCIELARTLKHLSPLTYLRVNLAFNMPHPGPGANNLRAHASTASSPAALAHLQQLVLQEKHSSAQRELHPSSHSVSQRFLSLLAAPTLTSLHFISDVAKGSVTDLLSSLRHMTALRALHIDADMHDVGASDSAPVHACDRHGERLLPQLHTLTITSACPVSPVAMAAAIIAASHGALTWLRIEHVHATERTFDGGADGETPPQCALTSPGAEGVQKAWAALCPGLGLCGNLRDLQLSCLCSRYDHGVDAGFSDRLSAALQQLPLLTRLRLEAACRLCDPDVYCALQGEPLSTALRALTGLRALDVCTADGLGAVEVSGREHVLAALPQLQQLSSLGLCFPGLEPADLADLISKLRCLRQCEFFSAALGMSGEQIRAFRARFPEVELRVCAHEPLTI